MSGIFKIVPVCTSVASSRGVVMNRRLQRFIVHLAMVIAGVGTLETSVTVIWYN